jgi:allantoin racemase
MRILVQHIWPAEVPFIADCDLIWRGHTELFAKVARADTVIEQGFVTRSPYNTMYSFLELLNDAELIKGIIRAERSGFDAAVISCGNDPGLNAAREAVSFPVVGITETAMHLACLLGSKFAAIVVDKRCIPLVERNLRQYGLEARAISRRPVRSTEYGEDMPQWYASPEFTRAHVIPGFEKVAQECIEDGAEVIVTACGGFGALALADYNKIGGTEVPVVNAVVAGLKMAELLADMRKTLGVSTSKHLSYSCLPRDMFDALTRPFIGDI